jgi:lycopene beta-cyclase
LLPEQEKYSYIILGAGASGLSLCCHLLEAGVRDSILILDRKPAFTDDRTWCFWNVRPNPFTGLAVRCWHQWEVRDTQGNRARQESLGVGYACLRGQDFYDHAQAEIARHANVTLMLGSTIENVEAFRDDAIVEANGTRYSADYVFDSRPKPVPTCRDTAFSQRFYGQFIRTDTPVFDPSRCTLMDFRVSQENGLHFFYILPFSPTEALIENTYIQECGTAGLTPEQHRTEISDYLTQKAGVSDFTLVREEAGAIPMTTQPFPRRDGRLFFIGTAGGCTKPSSGYTFQRIQEQCRQIAEAASSGTLDRFRERLAPARYRFFDSVFLSVLHDNPGNFPEYFYRLFTRVSPGALTAFLSETSTWRSDLQIMRSLPLGPFLRAALRSIRG